MLKQKKLSVIIALMAALSIMLAACGNAGSKPNPEVMDDIQAAVYSELKNYLTAEGVDESLFEDGIIPGYEIFRGNKEDTGFDAMAASLMVDADAIEDMLVMRSMIIVNADCIIVLRANDLEKAKAGLKAYHEMQLKQWESYLPDQYQKTKDTVTDAAGDYIYYVTSSIQQEVLEAIRAELK